MNKKEEFRMCANWKRFTLKAIIFASLSTFLHGCSSSSSSTEAPALKSVNGAVSDSATGLPISNATVTAYAIDPATGKQSTTPLSSASVNSNAQGNYDLKIPKNYAGGVLVEALFNINSLVGKTAKQTLFTVGQKIRTVVPAVSQNQTEVPHVMLSLATEMMVQYVEKNSPTTGFIPDNVKVAVLALEPFFGSGFTEIPPRTIGVAPTPAQQNLLIATKALDQVLSSVNSTTSANYTISDLVTVNAGVLSLGTATITTPQGPQTLAQIVTTAATGLVTTGEIPGTYNTQDIGTTLSNAANAPVPTAAVLTDTQSPTAPGIPTKTTSTPDSVTFSWTASTDNVAVTSYLVNRGGVLIGTVLPATALTFTDSGLDANTTYVYEVVARDAAGNLSAGSTSSIATTSPILTYSISGKIANSAGVGLSSAIVAISGAATGNVLTDASGNYTFTGVPAGSYTITPALGGFAFAPESSSVVVTTANVTGTDFTAVPLTPGTVTSEITNPDGSVTTTTTYSNGTVTIKTTYPNGTVTTKTIYPNGTVTTTTTYTNGTVTIGITYSNGTMTTTTTYASGMVTTTTAYPNGTVAGNTTYQVGAVATLISPIAKVWVSGRVTAGGNGLEGVLVTIAGAGGGSALTGPMGYYYISVASDSAYTISPPAATVLAPYVLNGVSYTSFTPATLSLTPADTAANVSGKDFAAL